jgi:dienelactone hydrolase
VTPAAFPQTATRERVVRFGRGQGLVGILTVPRSVRPGVPHVVFVNAGIVHRVGPNRLYVDMARALASLGYPVLRFDLSGIGDSAAADDGALLSGGSLSGASLSGGSLNDSAVADVQTALDFLAESRDAASFLLFGLCSGANYSLLTAFADPRVVGTMLIDPTTSRTRRGEMIHLARRLRHLATWGTLLTLRHPAWRRSLGHLRSLAVLRAATEESGERAAPTEQAPSKADVCASLQRLVDRGVELMMVFTGGVNQVYNYRGQLFDLLPAGFDFRGRLRLEYMPRTDHTVSDGPSRAQLFAAVGEWITRRFPGSTPSDDHVDVGVDVNARAPQPSQRPELRETA